MRLKVKDLDIMTGGVLIAVLHQSDAEEMDLHHEDRVRIVYGKKQAVAVLDITTSKGIVHPGVIGLMDELIQELGIRAGKTVEIKVEPKPESIQYIHKKLDGETLEDAEIDAIVKDISESRLTEIEISYFVAGTYVHHLSLEEIAALTRSMVRHGETLQLTESPVVDKHCIGGLAGNRTTMIVVPIVAAAGLIMPKTSSRAITSPAGTADVMEVLCKVDVTLPQLKRLLKRTKGCVIWGGSLDLAPADDRIIRVEKPLSIDAEGQMIASVMAKKFSVCSTHVLIDIPLGPEAKVRTEDRAANLKKLFEEIGSMLGMQTKVIITDATQPIGNGIGAGLEARDVLWVLMGDKRAPPDLRDKALDMAGIILEMGGAALSGEGKDLATEILDSGKAYKKMLEIIDGQGRKVITPDQIELGEHTFDVTANGKGTILSISNKGIVRLCRALGCPKDKGSGIYLHKHVNDRVKRGDKLFTLFSVSEEKLHHAKEMLNKVRPFEIT